MDVVKPQLKELVAAIERQGTVLLQEPRPNRMASWPTASLSVFAASKGPGQQWLPGPLMIQPPAHLYWPVAPGSDRKAGLLPPGICPQEPAGPSASLGRGSDSPISTGGWVEGWGVNQLRLLRAAPEEGDRMKDAVRK